MPSTNALQMLLPPRAEFKIAIVEILGQGAIRVQDVYRALAERLDLSESQRTARRAGQIHYQHEARFAKLDLIHEGLVERPESVGRGIWKLVGGLSMDFGALANKATFGGRCVEGAARTLAVNSYERNSEARAAAIAKHGCRCSVCGFNFLKAFGPIGAGVIHVHHLVLLSQIGESYELDPSRDLIPICPNCHAITHRRDPPFTPDELREMLRTSSLAVGHSASGCAALGRGEASLEA